MSRRCQFHLNSSSLRDHVDFTLTSLRFRFDVSSMPLRFNVGFRLVSLRSHFGSTSNPFRVAVDFSYFGFTWKERRRTPAQGKRKMLANRDGKGKVAAPDFPIGLTSQPLMYTIQKLHIPLRICLLHFENERICENCIKFKECT